MNFLHHDILKLRHVCLLYHSYGYVDQEWKKKIIEIIRWECIHVSRDICKNFEW